MLYNLNQAALEKFCDLRTSKCSSAAVEAIKNRIVAGSDFDCYKINAFTFAAINKLERRETLRAFLYATKLGIFDLNWDIHCPSCHGIPEYHRHLMGLKNLAHCELCAIDWDLDFEEQVEVTFTVNPDIRALDCPEFKDLDFNCKMRLLDDILGREGRLYTAAGCIDPGETKKFTGKFAPGRYVYYMPSHLDSGGLLIVKGETAEEMQTLNVVAGADGAIDIRGVEMRPGEIEFVVKSNYPVMNGFLVFPDAPKNNWVSAAYVTSLQDFRDLFAGEFLSPDTSFAIRSVTIMFTDIKSSTEMYEKLGDSRAYSVVNEHFSLMSGIINKHEGAIVKTIGDAVMASFPVNVNAVKAACEIQTEFLRASGNLKDVQVKIGLHRGPTIAVSSNRNLDYFGRTANIAARVQGKSLAGETLITSDVYSDAGVSEFIAGAGVEVSKKNTELKGLEGHFEVLAIRPGRN